MAEYGLCKEKSSILPPLPDSCRHARHRGPGHDRSPGVAERPLPANTQKFAGPKSPVHELAPDRSGEKYGREKAFMCVSVRTDSDNCRAVSQEKYVGFARIALTTSTAYNPGAVILLVIRIFDANRGP
ncbi:MAG: hypothetical protein AMJ65_14855 [Phycisphaerae bacterium SG8_4]|nr:MAG: hypothetical protein AMJ65_14855 [Phycisphaerae bacterium SG8_4]